MRFEFVAAWVILVSPFGVTACDDPLRGEAVVEHFPHPELFKQTHRCTDARDPLAAAVRAEEHAKHRRDRYPYDPRDGVLSVRGFGIAVKCYQLARRASDAVRIQKLQSEVRSRISVDYAASRLNLVRAISSEDWHQALSEARWLQQLTSHIGGHEYVDWLRETNGRASARTQRTR